MILHEDDSVDLIISIIFIILIIPMIILNGFVISTLWDWFVVPIFGFQSLTIPQALGLGLISTYLTGNITDYAKRSEDNPKDNLVYMLGIYFRPAIFLFMGWVCTWFM